MYKIKSHYSEHLTLGICDRYRIDSIEEVGVKSFNITSKNYDFCEYVIFGSIS